MSYVLTRLPAGEVKVSVMDPRGRSQHPALSVFPLVRAWFWLVMLALRSRVDVAHINISSHGSSIRKPILLWTCRLFRIPVVLHLHASEYAQFFGALPGPLKAILRRTFASADAVVVLGSQYRDYVCNELEVPSTNVKVILNGAPAPSRPPTLRMRRPEDPLRILFLGRIGTRKGVPEALAALAHPRLRAESWIAAFAGDGEIERYRAQAGDLGIDDRVTFPGWVDTACTESLLAESDLLLLPTHAEGLPMSVLEAFGHGVPVISTPVGAIPDVVEDGFNGLLVPAGDSNALAAALLRLIHDGPLLLQMAGNARRTWEERLDIASYTSQLVACWRAISTHRSTVN
jgi:glycosyltransferase involved in cell wall biosynthesis